MVDPRTLLSHLEWVACSGLFVCWFAESSAWGSLHYQQTVVEGWRRGL